MLKDSSLTMEGPCPASSYSFLDHYSLTHDTSSILGEVFECSSELTGDRARSSSLGFMDLLNMQDFGPSNFSLFDNVEPPPFAHNHDHFLSNAPATPNSSSISSESNDDHHAPKDPALLHDIVGQEPADDDEDDQDENKTTITKKQLKPKKESQKRKREPRFAFMTKSEVDHLEDGYRWRKYGQKAVKNSAFPRSYYRCTSASCNVKKRVERCWNDPTIVVTTYEGQHTHPSPTSSMQQRSPAAWHGSANGFSATNPQIASLTHSPQGFLYQAGGGGAHAQQQQQHPSSHHHHHQLLTDSGLLQDVVPSTLIKKEKQALMN